MAQMSGTRASNTMYMYVLYTRVTLLGIIQYK